MLYYNILYYTILYYTTIYYTILYYNILYYAIMKCNFDNAIFECATRTLYYQVNQPLPHRGILATEHTRTTL